MFFSAKFLASISIHTHRQGTAAWNSMASRFAYFVPGWWPSISDVRCCCEMGWKMPWKNALNGRSSCWWSGLRHIFRSACLEGLQCEAHRNQCAWSIRTYRNIRLQTRLAFSWKFGQKNMVLFRNVEKILLYAGITWTDTIRAQDQVRKLTSPSWHSLQWHPFVQLCKQGTGGASSTWTRHGNKYQLVKCLGDTYQHNNATLSSLWLSNHWILWTWNVPEPMLQSFPKKTIERIQNENVSGRT